MNSLHCKILGAPTKATLVQHCRWVHFTAIVPTQDTFHWYYDTSYENFFSQMNILVFCPETAHQQLWRINFWPTVADLQTRRLSLQLGLRVDGHLLQANIHSSDPSELLQWLFQWWWHNKHHWCHYYYHCQHQKQPILYHSCLLLPFKSYITLWKCIWNSTVIKHL